ncbi:hypothetical protein EVAR_12727_1 [Eumeta japonica]|uniref:Uncharacterized protein n=1 Tax=Eumeta variegata TaxID=151549 RepID=A0A4C1UML9_EUMVA|nr:hypothetical protein EVAR_12727_1 [Eumeta japonica]
MKSDHSKWTKIEPKEVGYKHTYRSLWLASKNLQNRKKNSLCHEHWVWKHEAWVETQKARGVIATVYQRMKFEAENGVERVTDARWRTSKAVGVSERTVTRILKQKRESDSTGAVLRSPHKMKKPRKCLRRDIDNFDMAVIIYTSVCGAAQCTSRGNIYATFAFVLVTYYGLLHCLHAEPTHGFCA